MTRVSALQAALIAFATPSAVTNLDGLIAERSLQPTVVIAEEGD